MSQDKYRKIEVMRMSGTPVSIEKVKKFNAEWRKRYDELHSKHAHDMKILHEKTDELEAELKAKYPSTEEWNWVQSQKEWKKLIRHYGPIAVVINAETKKLTYIILDDLGPAEE